MPTMLLPGLLRAARRAGGTDSRGCRRGWPVPLRVGVVLGVVGLLLSAGGCNELTGTPGLPSGTQDPTYYNSPAGALGMRNAALLQFEQALSGYMGAAGLLTDELEDPSTGASAGVLSTVQGVSDPLDERILPEGTTIPSYSALQQARGFAEQAVGQLAKYDTAAGKQDTSKILRGELYAIQGYTELMLADLFCSGVSLDTLVFQGDFTYAKPSTTAGVYTAALANFDSALTLASASDSVRDLAQVGKGRAYLALGNYPAAADDVTSVPSGFVYVVTIPEGGAIIQVASEQQGDLPLGRVADHKGINGLPFVSSGDPRSAATSVTGPDGGALTLGGVPVYVTNKYGTNFLGSTSFSTYIPFQLASGVEARLIEAEAALNAGQVGSWLATLNTLRATALIPGTTAPDSAALPPLSDPGAGLTGAAAAEARIDTLFTERAEWLYLDGHRQGDLRRLLRQYGRTYAKYNNQAKVYPTGVYTAPGTGRFGIDVTVPIDPGESANPSFQGCLDRIP